MFNVELPIMNTWLNELQISLSSKRSYARSLKIYEHFLKNEGLPLECVTMYDITRFARYLVKNYPLAGAHLECRIIKRFYRWAEAKGLLMNVAENLGVEGYKIYDKLFISDDEARRIIRQPQSARNRAALSLILRCAVRASEVIELKVDDLVLADEFGQVRLPSGLYLPLTHACANEMKEYVKDRCSKEEPTDFLFVSYANRNRGYGLTVRSVTRFMEYAFKDAKMPYPPREYYYGSAAVSLALADKEPADIIVALCDRTYQYRHNTTNNDTD